ncbi:hypothetical protein HKI87_10g63140 [Chloropicon roscoffensis]|uniref:Uncharacterized protein n=1 Tax=Chloropicon roscoffensis TaxID=1461544 RepID=A0AAX4PFI7_9CHLO
MLQPPNQNSPDRANAGSCERTQAGGSAVGDRQLFLESVLRVLNLVRAEKSVRLSKKQRSEALETIRKNTSGRVTDELGKRSSSGAVEREQASQVSPTVAKNAVAEGALDKARGKRPVSGPPPRREQVTLPSTSGRDGGSPPVQDRLEERIGSETSFGQWLGSGAKGAKAKGGIITKDKPSSPEDRPAPTPGSGDRGGPPKNKRKGSFSEEERRVRTMWVEPLLEKLNDLERKAEAQRKAHKEMIERQTKKLGIQGASAVRDPHPIQVATAGFLQGLALNVGEISGAKEAPPQAGLTLSQHTAHKEIQWNMKSALELAKSVSQAVLRSSPQKDP